jgi:hypothetical protein
MICPSVPRFLLPLTLYCSLPFAATCPIALATRGIVIPALICIPPLPIRCCVFLRHYCIFLYCHCWVCTFLFVSSTTPHSWFSFPPPHSLAWGHDWGFGWIFLLYVSFLKNLLLHWSCFATNLASSSQHTCPCLSSPAPHLFL